ncbi:hypothetical protein, partial [Streptococcus pneumoniae]
MTRFYIPQKLNDYIGQKKSKFIPFLPNPVLITKVMLYCSPILALFLCYACYDIQLNISKVPRNIITFLVGSVVAIIHELLIMIYYLKSGRVPGRIYIRIVYLVVISFGTEWGASYSEKKVFRTTMFLFSMISIFYLSAIFFMIFYPQLFTPNLKTIQNPCLSLDPGWFLFSPNGCFLLDKKEFPLYGISVEKNTKRKETHMNSLP